MVAEYLLSKEVNNLPLFKEFEKNNNNYNYYCFSLYTKSDLNICRRKLFKVIISLTSKNASLWRPFCFIWITNYYFLLLGE